MAGEILKTAQREVIAGCGLPGDTPVGTYKTSLHTAALANEVVNNAINRIQGNPIEVARNLAEGEGFDLGPDDPDYAGEAADMAGMALGFPPGTGAETMDFLESVWDFFSGFFNKDPLRLDAIPMMYGMQDALVSIGISNVVSGQVHLLTRWSGSTREMMVATYKSAFYSILRPVHIVIGVRPVADEGSLARMWEIYIAALNLGDQHQVQVIMANLSQRGKVQEAQDEYNNLQGQRAHWKDLANKIWLQYVLAPASSAGVDLSAEDNVLLTTLPEVFILKGI